MIARLRAWWIKGSIWIIPLFLVTGCGLFGGEKNTRPPTQLKPIHNKIQLSDIWSNHIGNGNGGYFLHLRPFIDQKVLYAASYDGELGAFSTKDGTLLWHIRIPARLVGGVAGGEGLLFVGGQNGILYAVSDKAHVIEWKTKLSSKVVAISNASDDMVVAHTSDGKLFGINVATGNIDWTYHVSQDLLLMIGQSRPMVIGNRVLCGFSDGKIAAFNIENGGKIWDKSIGNSSGPTEVQQIDGIYGQMVRKKGVIYAVPYHGKLAAIDIKNGQLLWSRSMSSYSGLTVSQNKVFVVDKDSNIWGLDANSGASLWKQSNLKYRQTSAPATFQKALVVGDYAGYLQWLSVSNGALIGRQKVSSGAIEVAPEIIHGILYMQASTGKLAAYRISVSSNDTSRH